jgi:hypothetical protein
MQLTNTVLSLFAVNGTTISLVGDIRLSFDLEEHPASTNVVIIGIVGDVRLSFDLEEHPASTNVVIIGIDWPSVVNGTSAQQCDVRR